MNVRKVKNMFNTFVDMVQFEILSCPDIDSAVKLIKRLLDIADLCKKEIGNYENLGTSTCNLYSTNDVNSPKDAKTWKYWNNDDEWTSTSNIFGSSSMY